ncbi:MAG: mechanosensitive ion channel family protein [Desulfurococcales archaeon]|nr:mechanosensitive ion channel family protein [Desulfurococcales archaeon]
MSEASIENMYSLIKSATIIVTLFIILYILTQQQAIAYFILGVILILIAASWEVIANVASYYVILISRGLNKGDLVSIDDIVGKVREINPFFVVVEGEDGVYKIPNRVVLHKMVKMPVEPAIVTLNIRIWGLDDPEVARSIIQRIEDEIATLTRPLVTSPRHLQLESSVEELSSDSVTISIKLPVPGRKVSRRKFNRLLEDLAVSLKETGYSFTISLQT